LTKGKEWRACGNAGRSCALVAHRQAVTYHQIRSLNAMDAGRCLPDV
jgi:hypothetical protein